MTELRQRGLVRTNSKLPGGDAGDKVVESRSDLAFSYKKSTARDTARPNGLCLANWIESRQLV